MPIGANMQLAMLQRGQQRSGGGGGGTGLQDIISQMQAAQEKANLVNEQRYRDILGTFENLGQAGRARIHPAECQSRCSLFQPRWW